MLRKFTLSIFIIAFILLIIPGIFFFALYRTALNPGFVHGELFHQAYVDFTPVVVDSTYGSLKEEMKFDLTKEEYQGLVQKHFTEDFARKVFMEAEDSFKKVIDGSTESEVFIWAPNIKNDMISFANDLACYKPQSQLCKNKDIFAANFAKSFDGKLHLVTLKQSDVKQFHQFKNLDVYIGVYLLVVILVFLLCFVVYVRPIFNSLARVSYLLIILALYSFFMYKFIPDFVGRIISSEFPQNDLITSSSINFTKYYLSAFNLQIFYIFVFSLVAGIILRGTAYLLKHYKS